jgi:hypothetical protein
MPLFKPLIRYSAGWKLSAIQQRAGSGQGQLAIQMNHYWRAHIHYTRLAS